MCAKRDKNDFFAELLPAESESKTKVGRTKPTPAHFEAYARIAVNEPVERVFDYGIPRSLIGDLRVGSLVEIPFGGRRTRGCVLQILTRHAADISASRIKPIVRVITPEFSVSEPLIQLARWMSDYYLASPGEALGCVSFIGYNEIGARTSLLYRLGPGSVCARTTARQKGVLAYLEQINRDATAAELKQMTGASPDILKRMVTHGLLTTVPADVPRTDDYGSSVTHDTPLPLNPAQQEAYDSVATALDLSSPRTFLIHGITGSGKTEVYLQLILRVLQAKGSAIVLVPEISLTPQAVDRFRSRFGDVVGVYHSRMTLGQKFDLWRRVVSGDCRIMVGARSALFTPFPDLHLIIIDEEHETSYKQDSSPRYHARDTAIMRAQMENLVVVLGTATPSVESYYKARAGKFSLLELPDRVENFPLPTVQIVNMTETAREEHNPDLFSSPLINAITAALERREQCLLLLNRRGFFNFMMCLECSRVLRCAHCDVALTHHKSRHAMVCHYCERQIPIPIACPECMSNDISLMGFGTQRVEEIVAGKFPKARIIRMDLDTTRQRNAFLHAWRRIENAEVDIILGTQMIAKGIHLENVTVVGVPLADVSLFQPDFRCAERAFSLLTQVAGRAGRGSKPGHVYVQTYVPHHYAIAYARSHDYKGFYNKEIRVREVLRFPPFCRLVSVIGLGADQQHTEHLFTQFTRDLRDLAFRSHGNVSVLGPAPAPIARINDQYRWRVLLRAREHGILKSLLQKALQRFQELPGHSKLQLTIDVDPLDLL